MVLDNTPDLSFTKSSFEFLESGLFVFPGNFARECQEFCFDAHSSMFVSCSALKVITYVDVFLYLVARFLKFDRSHYSAAHSHDLETI